MYTFKAPHFFTAFILLFTFMSIANSTAAQTWIELFPTGTQPDPDRTKTIFYDAANNRLIVFVPFRNNNSEVWILTNANGLGGTPAWSQLVTNGTAPFANGGESVAYDAATNSLIVYGGCQANCSPAGSDVRVLTNANGLGGSPVWSQISVTNSQARVDHRAIYNSTSNTLTTFGGHFAFFGTDQDDTRVLSNANGTTSPSTWATLSIGSRPSGRGYYSFVYDEANNRATLFAGQNLVSTCCPYVITNFNDTWVLSNADGQGTPAWTQLNPVGSLPSVRRAHSAVYDPVNNRMLVFGGGVWNQAGQSESPLGDLWELSNANGLGGTPVWTQLSQMGAVPSPRVAHGAAFDATNQRMIILGGSNNETPSTSNRVWVALMECVGASVPSDLQALRNTTLTIPVNTTDTTGREIISFDFTLNYDPAVLTPLATPFDTTGTLSDSYNITVNSSTPGTLVVSGFGTTSLNGAGVLLNLKFNVIGSAPSTSNLNFSSFSFNEGTPCAATTNGMFQVINGTISGALTYGVSMTPLAVPDVTMTATGSPNVTDTTNSSGAYSLSGFGNGAYTVTPSKTGDVNNSITAFDAAKVAQHVVGASTLTANQQIAADVSNNGSISSFDAALIAQYAIGLPNGSNAGTWRFVPANRVYPNVEADHPNQDYTAILMGEVSGNWTPPVPFSELKSSFKVAKSISSIGVSLSDQTAQPNSNVIVPINVQDTTGMNVLSYEFDLNYDPNVLQLEAAPIDTVGTLSNNMSIIVNTTTNGLLRVAAFGTSPTSGTGVLLKLKFITVGSVGSVSPLTWQRFMFNESNPQSATTNGQVRVASPTASTVFVSGRVMTADGNGVSKAHVTLTDMNGGTRTVITNLFGYYRFTDVPAAETYIFSVSHKRYSFSSQILTVTHEINSLNFVSSDFW